MSEPLYVDAAEKRSFADVLEENNRLKEATRRLADQDATLSVVGGNVIVEMDAALTDAERGAVERAADWLVTLAATRKEIQVAGYLVDDAATLRGLLERCAIGSE